MPEFIIGGGKTQQDITAGATGQFGGRAPMSIQSGSSMNTDFLNYWGRGNEPADLIKRGNWWRVNGSTTEASSDSKGYPTQAAWLIVADWHGAHTPGTYVLAWGGSSASLGTCTLTTTATMTGSAVSTITTGVTSASLGATWFQRTATLLSAGSIYATCTGTVAGITLKLLSEAGAYVAAEYTTTMARMNPKCIRVKDWQRIDWAQTTGGGLSWVVDWTTRATLSSCCWGDSQGVPAEMLINAAETLSCDLWLCLPHTAPSDAEHEAYIRGMATVIYAGQTDSKIIVEYGNELWNTNIGGGHWIDTHKGKTEPAGHFAAVQAIRAWGWFKAQWLTEGGSASDLIFAAMGQQTNLSHSYDTFLDTMTDTLIERGWKPDMVGCGFYAKPLPADIQSWKVNGPPTVSEYIASGIANCSVQLRAHLQRAQWTQTSRSINKLGFYEGTNSNDDRRGQGENWGTVAVDATLTSDIMPYLAEIASELIGVSADYFCWYAFRKEMTYSAGTNNWGHLYNVNEPNQWRYLAVCHVNGGS